MTVKTLNKNSWHFSFAKFVDDRNELLTKKINICRYAFMVLLGAILFTICMIGIGFLLITLTDAVASLYFWLIYGYASTGPLRMAPMGFFIIGLVMLGVICMLFAAWTQRKTAQVNGETSTMFTRWKERSLLVALWRRFKEQTCFYVIFK